MGALSLNAEDSENDVKNAFSDKDLPLSFTKDRHEEAIEGINCITQTWRMKERVIPYSYVFCLIQPNLNLSLQMKTVSVALVLCLNVGVDPPDIVKTQPCARLECWIGCAFTHNFQFSINLIDYRSIVDAAFQSSRSNRHYLTKPI